MRKLISIFIFTFMLLNSLYAISDNFNLDILKDDNITLNIYYFPTEVFTLPLSIEDIKRMYYYKVIIKNFNNRIYDDFKALEVDKLIVDIISQKENKFEMFDYRVLAEVHRENEEIISFGFTDPNNIGNVLINNNYQGQDELLYKYFMKYIEPYLN